jgi:hypothetical protein
MAVVNREDAVARPKWDQRKYDGSSVGCAGKA